MYLVVVEPEEVQVIGAELVSGEESCLDQGHLGLLVQWEILYRILQGQLKGIEVVFV